VRILADTHTLVWALETPELLSKAARSAMDDSEVTASVASLWELSLKCRKKDALVTDPLSWWRKYVTATGVPTLPIRISDVIALSSLPDIHKDPFDRIIVAQTVSEGIPLITKDAHLAMYGITTIW
jgi:PIN domain nuclease of toxin-antitoxin system